MSLELASDQQIEFLIGAAELDIGLERNRVVTLRERVKKFVDRDRLLGGVARGEVLALEHARDRVFRGELDHAIGAKRHQPFGIERDFGLVAVENQKHLIGIRLRVMSDFFGGQRRACGVAPGRIADHAGEIADQEDDVMAELLELPQLVELNGVAEMKVGARRVEALLDRERLPALELRHEFGLDQELFRPAFEHGQVMVDVEGHSRFYRWGS